MFGKSFVRHILQEAHSGLLGPWKAYIVEVGTISTPIVRSPCILCICKKMTDINVQSQYTGPLKNVNCFCVISGVEELSTFISQGRPTAACATRMPSLCTYSEQQNRSNN